MLVSCMASSTSCTLWLFSLLTCVAVPTFAWMTDTGKKIIVHQLNIPIKYILPPFTVIIAMLVHTRLVSFIEWAFLSNQTPPRVPTAPRVWTRSIIKAIVGIWLMVNAVFLAPRLILIQLLLSYSALSYFITILMVAKSPDYGPSHLLGSIVPTFGPYFFFKKLTWWWVATAILFVGTLCVKNGIHKDLARRWGNGGTEAFVFGSNINVVQVGNGLPPAPIALIV